MRKLSKLPYMANLSYDKVRGNAAIASGHADAVAYGVPFISNPDLVERFRQDAPLNEADSKSFYGGTEKGYIDYPTL
jgi:N-ethylmaleimide reductase